MFVDKNDNGGHWSSYVAVVTVFQLTFGRCRRKVLPDGQFDPELSPEVGRVGGPLDDGLHPGHVLIVQHHGNPLHRLHLQTLDLLPDQPQDLRVEILHVLDVGHHLARTLGLTSWGTLLRAKHPRSWSKSQKEVVEDQNLKLFFLHWHFLFLWKGRGRKGDEL